MDEFTIGGEMNEIWFGRNWRRAHTEHVRLAVICVKIQIDFMPNKSTRKKNCSTNKVHCRNFKPSLAVYEQILQATTFETVSENAAFDQT